ncbi:MAG: DUF302 domain-containing protein [bacterium]
MKKTSYAFTKTVNRDFDQTIQKLTEELKKEGFGILTEIDVQATLKKKLDVDFRPYKILGACNPSFAYKALQAEEQIALMLPCNVIVYVNEEKETVVAAIDPEASMTAIDNPELQGINKEVQTKLRSVIERC